MTFTQNYRKQHEVIPTGGGKKVGYARVSTVAGACDDSGGLITWSRTLAAIGVATDRGLLARLAALASTHAEPYYSDDKRAAIDLAEAAFRAGGGETAANVGTAIHAFTEQIDRGEPLTFVPDDLIPPLRAYEKRMQAVEVLGMEIDVVNDDLQVAGTLDRLLRLPDGRVVVADIKSGANDVKYPLKVQTQVALYASCKRYDQATGARTPLHPDLDTTLGVLIHVPAKADPATCELYPLDLVAGMESALLGLQVRSARKVRPLKPLVLDEPTLWEETA